LLSGAAWSDACILNISSRGLLIQTNRSAPQGSFVELRRGDHLIVARVVWRAGTRTGLSASERLPVEEILSLGQLSALGSSARFGEPAERRQTAREAHERSRLASRAMEFASVAMIAACLAGTAFALAGRVLARPIADVEAALRG
jgi:hypothetical protein